jgi:hypothetical protein
MWVTNKNTHIDIESICKRGRRGETRSESKVDKRGTKNKSSTESARKMACSLDPQEERVKPIERVKAAARSQPGHTKKEKDNPRCGECGRGGRGEHRSTNCI